MPEPTRLHGNVLSRKRPRTCWVWVLNCLWLASFTAGAGTFVQFRTALGDIEVDLFDQDKPVTVQNFLRYVRAGYYQNIYLHRCIPNFVVQGGEFFSLVKTDTNLLTVNDVRVWPDFPPIINEYSVGPTTSNGYGTLAMARASGQTNSATSQWFFNLSDNPALDTVDGGFTVFGRVVGGTNVLNVFNLLGLNGGIIDMGDWSTDPFLTNVFSTLPVTYVGAAPPQLSDLFYVDITLLNVRISRETGGSNRIRWTSVNGRTNIVEYTDGYPPDWKVLGSGVGTGGPFAIVDSSVSSPARFYRVRVDY